MTRNKMAQVINRNHLIFIEVCPELTTDSAYISYLANGVTDAASRAFSIRRLSGWPTRTLAHFIVRAWSYSHTLALHDVVVRDQYRMRITFEEQHFAYSSLAAFSTEETNSALEEGRYLAVDHGVPISWLDDQSNPGRVPENTLNNDWVWDYCSAMVNPGKGN
jgi:hypothetical protein